MASWRHTSSFTVLLVTVTFVLTANSQTRSLVPKSFIWLFAGSAITHLGQTPGGMKLLRGYMNEQTVWVYGKSHDTPLHSLVLSGAASLARFHQATMSANSYVLLDLEDWSKSPVSEQKHPVATYAQATLLAKKRGKVLIATPAFDLIHSVQPHYHGPIYPEFIRLGLARRIARYASVYEIQAQGIENIPSRYRALVLAIARQVQETNPHAIILAGLSTGPSGQKTTAKILYQDVLATRHIVAGYWLNIPGHGTACPRCTIPKPQLAVALLQKLQKNNIVSP